VGLADFLRKDPYKSGSDGRTLKNRKGPSQKKKFSFDQEGGTDGGDGGSGALKSKPVDPTFGIEGRI